MKAVRLLVEHHVRVPRPGSAWTQWHFTCQRERNDKKRERGPERLQVSFKMVEQRHKHATVRLLRMAVADKGDAHAAKHRCTILGFHRKRFDDNAHTAPRPNKQLHSIRTLTERRLHEQLQRRVRNGFGRAPPKMRRNTGVAASSSVAVQAERACIFLARKPKTSPTSASSRGMTPACAASRGMPPKVAKPTPGRAKAKQVTKSNGGETRAVTQERVFAQKTAIRFLKQEVAPMELAETSCWPSRQGSAG